MSEKIPLRKWIENFNNGLYDGESKEIQWKAGWCDYFCGENELCLRLRKIGYILNHITNNFILDNYYIKIYNRCPLQSPTYEQITFVPLDQNKYKKCSFFVSCGYPHDIDLYFDISTERNEYGTEFRCDTIDQLIRILDHLVFDFYYRPLMLLK